jgi:hypothetical protein
MNTDSPILQADRVIQMQDGVVAESANYAIGRQ